MAQMRKHNWFTVGRIAQYCLVTSVTVRRWIEKGELSASRLPSGHYRVSIADFRDFLERNHMAIKEDLFESESGKEGASLLTHGRFSPQPREASNNER